MESVIIVPMHDEQVYDYDVECDCSGPLECNEFCNAVISNKYCVSCQGGHHYSQCSELPKKSQKGKLLMMCMGSIIQGMMMRAIGNHFCEEVSLDDFVEFSEDLQLINTDCWGCHQEFVFKYKTCTFRIDMPPRDYYDDCVFEKQQSSLTKAMEIERMFIMHAFEHARFDL